MTLALDKTQALLEAAGFELQPGSGLGIGDTFHCRLDDEWFVQATGLYVHPDGGTIDETRYRFMHLSLNGHGTRHDFATVAALAKHLGAAMKEMQEVAAHPKRIRCPKCKVRMVRVQEPNAWSAKKYRPFLSCDGMMINRSTRNVSCDGILRTEPAIRQWG
ncbi:hypothetical protein [Paraburkholderia phenazinium]|uniref:hypothetical protein n=1 Tax=Paraburkholderia phenazinium TaxID=60549 RepID=UPI00158CBD98|nr:hypothetical protein [Paraburkholderia phenazinium]